MKRVFLILFIFLFTSQNAFCENNLGIKNNYSIKLTPYGILKKPEILKEKEKPSTFILKSLEFYGNRSFYDEELKEAMEYKVNAPITIQEIEYNKLLLLKFYRKNGYQNAYIKKKKKKTDEGIIIFEIRENI